MTSAERSVGFTGRRQEIELLERLVNSVKSGEGRLVTVTGHSGIGKTRLCAETSAIARAEGIPVIWGTAWPEANSPALWPWPEVLLGLGDTAALGFDSDAVTYAAEVGIVTSGVGDGCYELANELYRLRVLERELEADVANDHFLVGQYRLSRHASQQPESGGAPFHLAEAARLGLTEATPLAVDTLKEAAAHALRVGSYKAAAKHFGNAVEVHRLHLGPPPPALLVARAEAVLRSGRLADARILFDEAAGLAEADDDFTSFAVAALRMGGVWVNERRDAADRARTAAIQQRALKLLKENVPEEAMGLALRLEARIIAEEVYHGRDIADLERIVALAEDAGENRAVAESLLMVYNCRLGPQYQELRQKLTRRILEVCSTESDETIRLTAGCMHSVDLLLSHQLGAMAAFNSWRINVNAVGPKHLQYVARGIEVMNLIRAGQLSEAEALAHEVFDYGVRVGNSDAFAFLGGQLMGIYTVQGRCVELLDVLQDAMFAPHSNRADVSMVAGAAYVAASAGDERLALQALDIILRDGLKAIPQISSWLASMTAVAGTARLLGRPELAKQVYDLLIRYRHLPVRPSLAVTCFGSVEMALGWAASVFAKPELATDHYERAIEANERFNNRPYRAFVMADLAKHLISNATTGQGGERAVDRSMLSRAQGLLISAIAEASECQMPLQVEAWKAIADGLGAEQPEGLRLKRAGQWWQLDLGSESASVKHSVGMAYINRLLSLNGRELPVGELVRSGLEGRGRGDVADRQALAAYQTRIEDLRAEVDLASELNDVGRAAKAQDELEQLLEHLRSSTGLFGKSRTFTDETERARVAARKAIKRAIDRIAESNEKIGDHLRKAIRTGRHCSYRID